jgi:hypothetical protein
MIPLHIPGRVRVYAVLWAAFAIAACSSDPPSPLGSDNDLTRSKPGVVFDDTLDLEGDTVVVYHTALANDTVLEFARPSAVPPVPEYQRTMILQVDWAGASNDAAKTVQSAVLRLTADDVEGAFPARFYQLTEPYAEGDSLPSLDTLAVILDPTNGSPNRTLQTLPREYPLPPALVQGWIRDEIDRNAIAISYPDDVTDRIATFKAMEAARDRPQVIVQYVGGTSSIYRVGGDATFVRPAAPTSNLVISDGYVRRINFRLPLDRLAERSAIHDARVRLYIVPGSVLGSSPHLIVFIPASDDPTTKDFTQGQLVTTVTYQASADYMEFTMTNAIALMLQGVLENNGFTIRYDAENTQLRQVEFYGSNAADSLRPRVLITSSTPADFDPDEEP